MRNTQRLREWAAAYKLPNLNEATSPDGAIPSKPSVLNRAPVDFNGLAYRDVATSELQQLRTSKIASSSRLSLFASDQLNEKKQHKWTFSRQERGTALEKAFVRKSDAGLGQALIEYVPNDHLDVNVIEEDPKVGKKNNSQRRDSVQGITRASKWLERASAQGELQWVELFASRGAKQPALNAALKAALDSNSMQRTEICGTLLLYGADPNLQVDTFIQTIQMSNRPLLEKFLTSATPLSSSALAQALSLAVSTGSYPTVSLLLAHGADCNKIFNETIHASIQLFDTRMLCVLLLGSSQIPIEQSLLQRAVSTGCALPDDQIKVQVLDLLLSYGASVNDPVFHDQFLMAIEKNNLDLLSMLVSHRILENVEQSKLLEVESLRLAISKLRYECLRILLRRPMSRLSVSTAMDMIPPSASEEHAIQLISILAEIPYETGCCGRTLLRAVKQHEMSLLNLLLPMNPSIGFQDAQVVRLALDRQDLALFDQLLEQGRCSPPILSKAIPHVFQMKLPEVRKHVMFRLIEKGIVSPELDLALQKFTEPELRDVDIVTALLTAGASVNYSEGNINCVQNAARNGDVECLTQLCQANPRPSDATLYAALPFAFAGLKTMPYETVLGIMQLLLPEDIVPCEDMSRLLINAIREDKGHQIIYLLVKRGADVNYENGLAFEIAYKLQDPRPWQLLCNSGRLNPTIYAQLLPQALENAGSDPLRSSTLLKCGNQHQSVLSQLLIEEARTKCRKEVMSMLIKYGADVDHSQGHAISQAIGRNSIDGVQLLLEQKPNQASLAQAFSTARRVSCSAQYRADVYASILAAPYTGAPVNEALVEAINKGELKVVTLLLDQGASVDFDQGRPLELATQSGSQPMLDTILARNPHPESIVKAFNIARQASMTDQRRLGIFNSLLRFNIPVQYKSAALLEAATRGSKSIDIYRLLQNSKASLDFEEGKALCILVARGDLATTAFLMENGSADIQTLDYAFNCAMSSVTLDKRLKLGFAKILLPVSPVEMNRNLELAVKEGNYELLELLIKSGANPGLNRESVQSAALNGDFRSLKTLLALVADDDVVSDAFQELLDQKSVESHEHGLQVAEMLLNKGVKQELQSRALLEGFSYGTKRTEFVNLMLKFEPDVNVAQGQCFMHASSMDDLTIFDKMLEKELELDAIVPTLISSRLSEEQLLELLERCFASGASFETWSSKLVFQAMEQYPASEALMKLLIQNGCSPGETEELKLDPRSEREPVTPLIWALTRPRPGVRDSVILALLDAGEEAKPNFVTDSTEICAILKAVQASRHDIIQRLIGLGAEVDVRDAQERFPLFYASSRGDARAVHQLITAGARTDDGSLHEAARELHMDIVQQLVAAGHSPNAPSEHHGGRTPLAELCLNARPEGRQWESRARKIMEALFSVTPADRKYQDMDSNERKNVIHLAIDNPAGFEVVRCLLGFKQVYDNLSSDAFLFEDSSSTCYSPTRYVEHFYVGSDSSEMKQKLIRLLKSRNCEDRYFRLRGAQPQGYTGVPKFMIDTDRRNMIEYQKHEEDMKRLRERAELEMELSNRQAAMSLQQESHRHRQMLEQSSAMEAVENSKRMNLLEYNKQSSDQQLSLDTARWLTEHEHAERRRQAELNQANRLANVKSENIERQARAQERLLERGDESVRRREEAYKRLMNVAARTPGIAPPSMPNLLTETPD